MKAPHRPPDSPPVAAMQEMLGMLNARQWGPLEAKARGAARRYPGHFFGWKILGAALQATDRLPEARDALARAVALVPQDPLAHALLGNALRDLGSLAEAEASFRRALALKPNWAEAHNNLGTVLRALGRPSEAETSLRQALALKPDYADSHFNLGNIFREAGQAKDASAEYEWALKIDPHAPKYFHQLLACATYRDDLSLDDLKALHLRYRQEFSREVPPLPLAPRARGDKLRIGYLSSDLRNHSVARNIAPVIRAHDRSAFDIHFYSQVAKPDAATLEFQSLADGWRDIRNLTDAQAAERIRADGIDILVSLAGRLDQNRPQICGLRAAPVQISLHDAATSGLEAMDYIVADRWLIPGAAREYFAERPLRLPNYYIAQIPRDLPEIGAGIVDGPPVFGCFNNPMKITPSVLSLWGRILAAMPEARLVLKYLKVYEQEPLRARFAAALIQAGAQADQIEFLTEEDTVRTHLERYNGIDVALDTFPFSGSTTSFEALVMGAPVVTLPWDRMASRWTLGMLQVLGMTGLVADSGDAYVTIALETARDRSAWRARRQEIRDRLTSSCLCDGELWARRIERLYRAVWQRRLKRAGGVS